MDSVGDRGSSQSREETPDSDSGYNAQVTVITTTTTTTNNSKPPMPLPQQQPQQQNSLLLNEIRLRKPPIEPESSYVNITSEQGTPPPPARDQKPTTQQQSPQSNLSSPGKE